MAMNKRIALITGATRGIGKAISLALAKEDIHVILLGRTIGALEEISDKIHLNGGNATCVQFDLNDLTIQIYLLCLKQDLHPQYLLILLVLIEHNTLQE